MVYPKYLDYSLMPYDYYYPFFWWMMISNRCCKACGIYFASRVKSVLHATLLALVVRVWQTHVLTRRVEEQLCAMADRLEHEEVVYTSNDCLLIPPKDTDWRIIDSGVNAYFFILLNLNKFVIGHLNRIIFSLYSTKTYVIHGRHQY